MLRRLRGRILRAYIMVLFTPWWDIFLIIDLFPITIERIVVWVLSLLSVLITLEALIVLQIRLIPFWLQLLLMMLIFLLFVRRSILVIINRLRISVSTLMTGWR
jgi:hypothetical protein